MSLAIIASRRIPIRSRLVLYNVIGWNYIAGYLNITVIDESCSETDTGWFPSLTFTWPTCLSRYNWDFRAMTFGHDMEKDTPSGGNNIGDTADPAIVGKVSWRKVSWRTCRDCMPGSLTSRLFWSRWWENFSGIPSTCATRNFTCDKRPMAPEIYFC